MIGIRSVCKLSCVTARSHLPVIPQSIETVQHIEELITAGSFMQACPLPADLDEAAPGLPIFASMIREVFTAAASSASMTKQTHLTPYAATS